MAIVLIVEDEEQVRVLAEAILQEAGHETRTAATVPEALAILETDQALDLLFTDVRLGEENHGGLEVAQRANSLRPGIHVLYTTGQGVTDGTRQLFVEGWHFLAKPYTPDALLTATANALANRPRG